MGRSKITIPIHGDLLWEIIKSRTYVSDLAPKLYTTRTSVYNWIKNNEIPPRQLSNLVKVLSVTPEEVRVLHRETKNEIDLRREVSRLAKENETLKNMIRQFMGDKTSKAFGGVGE